MFTPQQLQSLVTAYAVVVTLLIPIVGSVIVMGITQYGKVKEALTRASEVSSHLDSHSRSITQMRNQMADNQTEIGFIKGALNGQLSNGNGHDTGKSDNGGHNGQPSPTPTN